MPTTIEILWADLETDTSAGLLFRRYSATVQPDVFAGIRRSSATTQRLLAVSLPAPVVAEPLTLHDLALTVETDTARPGRQLVLLTLTNRIHSDMFAVVCEDLITQIADENDSMLVLNALLNRLEQWTTFFEGLTPDGLSAEKQQGLFGELWFLNRWLDTGADSAHCLMAWTGPDASIHDFQLSNRAVELKTTAAVNPQAIQISNERQLDDTGLLNLWLWLLTLDVRPTGGQSLNDMADELLNKLSSSPGLQNQLRLKLYKAGYQPIHRILYDSPTYAVRKEQVFRVLSGFPRLQLSDIPDGVSAVKYAVALAACRRFVDDPTSVLSKL